MMAGIKLINAAQIIWQDMMNNNSVIEQLISCFARLPGLGPRSARRLVLQLLRNKNSMLLPLQQNLLQVAEMVAECDNCGNVDVINPCGICSNKERDCSIICVVEDVADLWAIERSRMFNGVYHVLGGTLSAIDGRGPKELGIEKLLLRVQEAQMNEVILATNHTIEGQTTAHYITELLAEYDIKITRLAQGIPMGGELDYLDDATLGAAFNARLPF